MADVPNDLGCQPVYSYLVAYMSVGLVTLRGKEFVYCLRNVPLYVKDIKVGMVSL